jgi:fumarate reductase subunit D
VYVGARREYIANRNFRSLAVLGDEMQTMITIHGSILEFYADLVNNRHRRQLRKPVSLKGFLVLRPEDAKLPQEAQERESRMDYLRYLAPTFELNETPAGSKPPPAYRFHVQRRDGRWELGFAAIRVRGDKKDCEGSLVLDNLLTPLAGSLPFDDILLASEDGTIVYQNRKAGPQFTTLASLLDNQVDGAEKKTASDSAAPAQTPRVRSASASASHAEESGARVAAIKLNDDQAWRTKSMHLTDVRLAGTRYKVFLQPILVDVFSDVPTQDEPAREWVLCGLRSSAALEWEALAISYTLIIWLTVLFFVICMGGPVLKVFFLNQRERLRLRELAFLALFLILLSSVFTLSGLQAVYFHLNDYDTDGQLQQLGDNLSRNIHRELGLMRDQLQALCRTENLKNDLRAAETREVVRKANEVTAQATIYPYFNNAFWTDDNGDQIVKWSMADYVTPMIDLSQLPIYTSPKTMYLDGKNPPFHFASILPPNKLEYLAALTMSTCDCNPALCDSGTKSRPGIRQDVSHGSAFLSAQLFSLIDPVLPFGYGFTLVDRKGLALFHVDKTRNMRENFRQESDWNKELYAATFGHASQRSLRIKYLGKDYRVRVIPVADVSQAPWSLIVYRDLSPVRTLNLQTMTMTSTLLLLILVGPVVVLAIWCAIHRPRFAPEWLWPNRGRMMTYWYQLWLYALLIILLLFLVFTASSEEIIVACAAVPYTALLLTFWCFRSYPCPPEERVTSGRLPAGPAVLAALAASVFLVVLILHWDHLKQLTFLLVFGIIAAVPLLDKPRQYLVSRFNHRYPASGAAGQNGPEPVWLSYRASYALSVLLLLLMIGVLTPIGLFRAGLSVERRLRVKQAQLHLASALERHQLRIRDQHENGERADAAYAEFYRDGAVWRGMGLVPLFQADGNPALEKHLVSPGEEFYSDWFRRLIYVLHHDYNDAAAEMLGVIPDRSNPQPGNDFPDWTWQNEKSAIYLRWHGAHPLASEAAAQESDLVITSSVPAFTRSDTLVALGVAAGVTLLMGGLFWALARRIFLFHITPLKITGARQVAEAIREGRNILVLVPPVSNWELEGPKWTMDLTGVATRPKWAELLDLDTVPMNTLIEIRRFEYSTDDPEIDNQKLVLLERMIHRENTQVAAVMTVDASPKDYRRMFPGLDVIDLREEPFPWLQQYQGPARDLIWKECGPMPALWPIGAQLAQDIRTETIHSEDTIASEILERADAYYRLIWKDCSKEQKFVLAQLAEDGLLNPTNGRSIRQLMRRSLVTQDPQFRIMNESFRRFLRSAVTPELKQEWVGESRRSGWGKVHGAFFTTMILVGIFLLTTQNELWQSSAAYVTTAFGALGTVAKLFNTFRGGGTAEKAG